MSTNPARYFIFNVPLTHRINVSNKIISEILCRQINGYDEEYLLYKMNLEPSNNFLFDVSNKLIEKTIVGFSYRKENSISYSYSENENKEIVLNLSLGDKNKMLLLLRKSILGDILQLETNCIHCNEKISQDLPISEIIEYSNQLKPNYYLNCNNLKSSNDDNDPDNNDGDDSYYDAKDDYINCTETDIDDFKDNRDIDKEYIQISPITVRDHYVLIEYGLNGQISSTSQNDEQPENTSNDNSDSVTTTYEGEIEDSYIQVLVNHLIKSDQEESLKKLSKRGMIELINDKLLEIDPLSYIDLNLICPYCQKAMVDSFYTEHFILQELYMYSKQLPIDINWIALNYNWTEDDILSLPLSKRKQYVELISKSVSGELFL